MRDTAAPLKAGHMPKNKHRAEGREYRQKHRQLGLVPRRGLCGRIWAQALRLKLYAMDRSAAFRLKLFGASFSVQATRD